MKNFLSTRIVLAASSMLLGVTTLRAQSPAPTPAFDEAALVKQADVYDLKLKAGEALNIYLQVEKQNPNNAQLMVKIARQYRHLMADASSTDEKKRLGALALDYGTRAAAIAPKNSDAQLSPALTHGKMLDIKSSKEQVKSSIVIRECAEKALKVNPRNDLALYILGRWHRVICDMSSVKKTMAGLLYEKLPPGSTTEAISCLQRAVAINPERALYQIELGKAYAQAGRTADARKALEKGMAMPNKDKDDPDAKAQGRVALQGL